MENFSVRQDQIEKWTAQNFTVNPRARARRITEHKAADESETSRSDPGVWFKTQSKAV